MDSPWLEQLNEDQRRAATHGEGPLLIVAGAGTGKTKTLASRVAELIARGTAPDAIMLLTFTRRAAAEMIQRVAQMTSPEHAKQVWGGTFHATANRLLRMFGESVGLPPAFTVLDESDAADLMNLVRGELGVAKKDRRFPRKQTLVKIYSSTVNAQRPLGEILEEVYPWCIEDADAIRQVFDLYLKRKRANAVLDYDDLLLYWLALVEQSARAEHVARRFEHILVDEYQDTNIIQSDILRAMRRNKKNITAVGDDAQAIYSFRGATIRNILDFGQHFESAENVTLEQNYRSTPPILAASNAVMDQAKERYTKNLWSSRDGDAKPILNSCEDETAQTRAVCERILERLEEGIPLMQQAVLFRTGTHSAQLEIELAKRNIPFHKFGGLKFVEAAHIKDLLSILRILENPWDELSWFRVLLLFEGVGPRTAQRVMQSLGVSVDVSEDREEDAALRSPLSALLVTKSNDLPPPSRTPLRAFARLVAECTGFPYNESAKQQDGESGNGHANAAPPPPLQVQIERIRAFYIPLFEQRYDDARIRIRDIDQLEQIAASYSSRTRFVADLALDPPRSTSDLAGPPHLEEDWLTLSTIHSAKGCEWRDVHVIHVADGMIPSDMAITSDEGVEEERRLLYVAMTRAKDRLHLHVPLRYYHRKHALGDAHSYAQISRYLTEDVLAHCERTATGMTRPDETRPIELPDAVSRRLSELW